MKDVRIILFFALFAILAPLYCSGQWIGPDAAGNLPPVSQPPWPKRIPGYTEVDPATGLHMTGTPQHIDIASYRLKVTGKVDKPLNLTFDELRRLPRLAAKPALICEGYFEDYANWAGASLTALLNRAGVRAGAREVDLIGADGYSTSLTMAEARSPDAFLAYELEGRLLPVLQGFPLRAVFPRLNGYAWAKWIVEIRVK
ncbi:MAG: molybdopterin-dependent oxidoreductase [Rectinemataceae bacterium]|jgi:DMSO/TMAO reductase YedYZ molybdopterin-dependent catalytic subunit